MNSTPAAADDPRVQQLAEAMRAGLERRRSLGALNFGWSVAGPFTSETRAALRHYADLIHFPAMARRGRFTRLIRFLRGLAKPLIRPWLGIQTEFNRRTLEALQALHHELRILQARVEECRDRSEHLQAPAETAGRRGQDPPVVLSPSERNFEHLFVHTRLPPPPAHVLDLGSAESTTTMELVAFGYQVVGAGRCSPLVRHPSQTVVRADTGSLPLADATFDAAIRIATRASGGPDDTAERRTLDEVRRVLRPGGRFIWTVPFGRAATDLRRVYDRPLLASLLHAFRPVEMLFAVRAGETWVITPDAGAAGRVDAAERVNAVALVVVEKP